MNRRNNNLSLKVDHRPDQSGDFPIFDPDLSMEFVDDLISSFQNQFEPDANFIEEIDPKNLSPSEVSTSLRLLILEKLHLDGRRTTGRRFNEQSERRFRRCS